MSRSVYVVIGVGRWPEDGFEVFRYFENEADAEDYAETRPAGDRHSDWETYYVKEVEHGATE